MFQVQPFYLFLFLNLSKVNKKIWIRNHFRMRNEILKILEALSPSNNPQFFEHFQDSLIFPFNTIN